MRILATRKPVVVLLCLLAAIAVGVCTPRVLAQDTCDAPVSSVYVLQTDADVSPEGVALVNDWHTDDTRWQEAIGRPEVTLYINAEAAESERQYWLVYASRADADAVVVMRWSHERMFGRNTPTETRNHPDCLSGAVSRADVDAALAAQP